MEKSAFSTYAIATTESLLKLYGIRLGRVELLQALTDANHPYRRLLYLPTKHLFNGLIIAQAKTYQTHVQQKMIDYLLSPEAKKTGEEAGASTRAEIEKKFQAVLANNQTFEALEKLQLELIGKTQRALIPLMKLYFKNPSSDFFLKTIQPKLQVLHEEQEADIVQLTKQAIAQRQSFRELIGVLENALLQLSYPVDFTKNKEDLYFIDI